MKRLVFLSSGGGGTFRCVYWYLKSISNPPWEIVGVIADRPCGTLEDARKYGILTHQIDYSAQQPQALHALLATLQPDLIVSTFLKQIDAETCITFQNRLLNLHYSLLPEYKGFHGINTLKAICADGKTESGTTVHWVTAEVDTGGIIAQNHFPLPPNRSLEELMELVFRAACLNLLNVLCSFQAAIAGTTKQVLLEASVAVRFDQDLALKPEVFTSAFWEQVKNG